MPQPEQQRRAAGVSDRDLELLKAVAQAWLAQSGNPKPSEEFHARRRGSSARRPTRFKLEATAVAAAPAAEPRWDFARSLWDSYEIVTISRKLEAACIFSSWDAAVDLRTWSSPDPAARPTKRSRGSKKGSLMRKLFRKCSSSSSSKSPDHFSGEKTASDLN